MAKFQKKEQQEDGRDERGRFVEGNKYAQLKGHFQSVEELQKAAEEYIETTRVKTTGAFKPTLTGLCYHLGFQSLQSFYDYENREPYSYTVKRLRLFIQSCYEQNLYGFAWAGAFAALRNIGREDWKDENTQNISQTVTTVNPTVLSSGTPLANKEEDIQE